MKQTLVEYGFAAVLVFTNTAVILTGHSNDPGAASLLGFLGLVITALIGHQIADTAARKAANGTVLKLLGPQEEHKDDGTS